MQTSTDQRRDVARSRGRPWVRLQAGVSLDGRTALDNGLSQWINGEESRIDSHAWRHRADAVLTGIGTVLADDPRLDVRLVPAKSQPLRVVLDSKLRTPATARLFDAPGPIRIYTGGAGDPRGFPVRERGAVIRELANAGGQIDLAAVMQDLSSAGVQEIHVEAGSRLNGALLHAGLVDELLVYVAPKLLGTGAGLAAIGTLQSLDEALKLRVRSLDLIGADVRLILQYEAVSAGFEA